MSNSVRPHRRLPHPWDSPGKNTGVGCHFLLQCMKVKTESEVVQWCPILCDPMDCSPSGSPVHVIFQARVLEWGAITFSETISLTPPHTLLFPPTGSMIHLAFTFTKQLHLRKIALIKSPKRHKYNTYIISRVPIYHPHLLCLSTGQTVLGTGIRRERAL